MYVSSCASWHLACLLSIDHLPHSSLWWPFSLNLSMFTPINPSPQLALGICFAQRLVTWLFLIHVMYIQHELHFTLSSIRYTLIIMLKLMFLLIYLQASGLIKDWPSVTNKASRWPSQVWICKPNFTNQVQLMIPENIIELIHVYMYVLISKSIVFTIFFFLIIMHKSVKLNDAIWLLQPVISFSLIHALGNPSQVPTRIWTQVPSLRGGQLINWAPWPGLKPRISQFGRSVLLE